MPKPLLNFAKYQQLRAERVRELTERLTLTNERMDSESAAAAEAPAGSGAATKGSQSLRSKLYKHVVMEANGQSRFKATTGRASDVASEDVSKNMSPQ